MNFFEICLSVKVVNSLLSRIKVPSEFSRRTRDLNFGNYKAEEYRNLIVFYFEAIWHQMKPGSKEDRFMTSYVYLSRLLLLPDDEAEQDKVLKRARTVAKESYKMFQVSWNIEKMVKLSVNYNFQ